MKVIKRCHLGIILVLVLLSSGISPFTLGIDGKINYSNAQPLEGIWNEVFPSTSPGPKRGAAWAYDSINNVIVLFGGGPGTRDTWIYYLTTQNWEQRFPDPSPPGRSLHVMTFDSRNSAVVLFGGYRTSHSDELNDTWVYDVKTNIWRELHPNVSPAERHWPSLAYDSKNSVVVLFGGHNRFVDISQEQLNDTWLLDVATETWTQVFPVQSPSPRQTYLIYNEKNSLIYAFGGKYEVDVGDSNFDRRYYNDMWSYDLSTNTWTKLLDNSSATNVPAPRRTKMAYDPNNDLALLFGGEGSMFKAYDDTWVYNFHTNTWTEITPKTSPLARYGHAIIYDPFNHKVLVYGGASMGQSFSDMWELVSGVAEVENTAAKPAVPSEITQPTFGGYDSKLLLAVGVTLLAVIVLLAFLIKRHWLLNPSKIGK